MLCAKYLSRSSWTLGLAREPIVNRQLRIPAWLRPERTILIFVLVWAAVVIPVGTFTAVQSIRFHSRAHQLSLLQPGTTREEVISRVGRPTSESSIGPYTYWFYVPTIPEFLRLPFVVPDGTAIFFSPEGRVLSTRVLFD